MAKEYIEQEVKKIIDSHEFPKNIALASAWIIAHYKGINIKIHDMSELSSLCDFNIIASAENTTQARAMIDTIEYNLKQAGQSTISLEGLVDGEWILLDLGDIIVHIFQETSREVIDLDRLWKGAPQVEIPQEYYFGPAKTENSATEVKEDSENYF